MQQVWQHSTAQAQYQAEHCSSVVTLLQGHHCHVAVMHKIKEHAPPPGCTHTHTPEHV